MQRKTTRLVLAFLLLVAATTAPAAAGIPWIDGPSAEGNPWIDASSLWERVAGVLGLAATEHDRGSGIDPDGLASSGESGPRMDPIGLSAASGGDEDVDPGIDPLG